MSVKVLEFMNRGKSPARPESTDTFDYPHSLIDPASLLPRPEVQKQVTGELIQAKVGIPVSLTTHI